jgi:hypothetical protein
LTACKKSVVTPVIYFTFAVYEKEPSFWMDTDPGSPCVGPDQMGSEAMRGLRDTE